MAQRAEPPPAYYSAEDNPLGSRRAFLDAARRGAFPSFKAGRRVLARREDVHLWIESRQRKQPAASTPEEDVSDRELLERAGVRLKRGTRR